MANIVQGEHVSKSYQIVKGKPNHIIINWHALWVYGSLWSDHMLFDKSMEHKTWCFSAVWGPSLIFFNSSFQFTLLLCLLSFGSVKVKQSHFEISLPPSKKFSHSFTFPTLFFFQNNDYTISVFSKQWLYNVYMTS